MSHSDKSSKSVPYIDDEKIAPQTNSLLSRRNFLRATAIATGGALTANTSFSEPAKNMHHMDEYRSMMFEKGHKMAHGLVIEPPGAPAGTGGTWSETYWTP